jgi:hypothetical protein
MPTHECYYPQSDNPVTVPFFACGFSDPNPGKVYGILNKRGLRIQGGTRVHGTHWVIHFAGPALTSGTYTLTIVDEQGRSLCRVRNIKLRNANVHHSSMASGSTGGAPVIDFPGNGSTESGHKNIVATGSVTGTITLARLTHSGGSTATVRIIDDTDPWAVQFICDGTCPGGSQPNTVIRVEANNDPASFDENTFTLED